MQLLKWMQAERTTKQRIVNIIVLFILIILLTIASAKVNMQLEQNMAEQALQAAELAGEQTSGE